MAVRFVVGRAGSGKTWRCLEAIRSRLRENAVEGNRLLLLVPEQASFQMERALIETPDIAGYTRCEVLSFQRLAFRIFAETGVDPRREDQTIGLLGRLMAIRRLIRQERPALRLLGRVADKPGLIKQISGTFDELMREDVPPESLGETVNRLEQSDPLSAAKVADLARLYRAYLDYLIDDRMDPAQYLDLAAQRLEQLEGLSGAEIWVDGFAGFTRQEYVLLSGLAQRAAQMEITMLVDPNSSAVEARELPALTYSLFARTERTLVRLRQHLEVDGIRIVEPIRLSASPSPRFKTSELDSLERHLFRSSTRDARDSLPGSIRLVETPNRRCEVEAAVAEIQRLVHASDPPMRYRDIAIIVRDLNAYHDLLSGALRSSGIAFFIDCRQPTAHHPLVELVRSLLAIAADDCRLESVRLTLKTGLLPISNDDADLLENYILAHGINGRASWNQEWHLTRLFRKDKHGELTAPQREMLARVNAARTQWRDATASWLNMASDQASATGRAWAEALFACLAANDVGPRLHVQADEADEDGRTDEADAHRQVWVDFVRLLDEFVRALGTERMTVEEFRETVEAGLSEFNLGLAPPTLDQVLIGAIERSRHPAVRAALVLGFDERHFPIGRQEDPLLGDTERDLLSRNGMEIGPSRRVQLLDERMLAYIALTRASESLWISYPRTDTDGQPVESSSYLDDLLAAVPGLRPERMGDPRITRDTVGITSVAQLGERLAGEMRMRPARDGDPGEGLRTRWNGLYEVARNHADWKHTLERCLAGLRYRNEAVLPAGLMERISPKPLRASVSRLERFAACPFAHFAEYTLSLQQRVEPELQRVDLGNVCHAILEKFIQQLADRNEELSRLEDDDIAERIDAAAKEIEPQIADDILLGDARNAYQFDRSRGHLQRVTRWQRDAARAGQFRPKAAEYPFGLSHNAAHPLTLTTPAGRTIWLRGVIDRVDIAELGGEILGTVIDYKHTTDRRLDLTRVYHGLALQLTGYLLALKQIGESLTGRPIRPVAAFYLPLLEPYQSVEHPSIEKKNSYRWRGIVDLSVLQALDRELEPGDTSRFMPVKLNKDGSPSAHSDAADREQLSALMAHVGRRIGELADSLLDGEISVRPYRLNRSMPCSWCPFKPVCRYEIEFQPPRVLASLGTKQQILKRIMEEQRHD